MGGVRGITSREYKLILDSARFADRRGGTVALQALIDALADKLDIAVEAQGEEETRRTWYLDTPDRQLRREGFLLRVRLEDADGRHKVVLKHRSPDRYVAAARNLGSTRKRTEWKFEEDILPPFRSLFSQSVGFRARRPPELATVGDAVRLFPGLAELGLPDGQRLEVVNGFEALEVFCRLCKLRVGRKPPIKVGLGLWYRGPEDGRPLIAECAYDYQGGDAGDDFTLAVVRAANALFGWLQEQPGWVDPAATTKTRFAYEGADTAIKA